MVASDRKTRIPEERSATVLNEALEHRAALYVLAAGAALGLVPPAQARVIVTPSNAVLYPGKNHHPNTLAIDLNNDGVKDIVLIDHGFNSFSIHTYRLDVEGYRNNYVMELEGQPEALFTGAKIGPSAFFQQSGQMCYGWNDPGSSGSRGPFSHAAMRFLGVRFLIEGELHYGWIGFRSVGGNGPFSHAIADLLGWAYETVPNRPILTGFGIGTGMDSREQMQQSEQTSLALLAAGHERIADWRRRKAS